MRKKKVGLGRLLLFGCLFLTLVVCVAAQVTESVLARARKYEPHFIQAGQRHGVDPRLLWVVGYLESRFQPAVISPKGARGLMQFMPGTANRYGLRDPHDPVTAIDAAARYLRDLLARYGQRVDLALAAYNAGEGAVDAALANASTNGIPLYRETRSYVQRGLLMLQEQAATTKKIGASSTEKADLISEGDVLPALPRGIARQSLFIYQREETKSVLLKPSQRQSHYFGTRIDNAAAVPPKHPHENATSQASERLEEQ